MTRACDAPRANCHAPWPTAESSYCDVHRCL